MQAGMHRYVCRNKCMIDLYKPANKTYTEVDVQRQKLELLDEFESLWREDGAIVVDVISQLKQRISNGEG